MDFQGKEKITGSSKYLDRAFDEANVAFADRLKILRVIESSAMFRVVSPVYESEYEEYITLLASATNDVKLGDFQ